MPKTTVINIKRNIGNPQAYRYIGRGTIFGNPFYIGKDGTREEAIEKFRKYFKDRLQNDSFFKARILNLKGKVLGCYCKPKACHGDVIAKYVDTGIC